MTLLTGIVKGRDGRPLAETDVLFVAGPLPLPKIAQLTGPDGQFSLSAPAPGAYRVRVNALGHEAARISFEVGDEGEIEQDVALR